MATSQRILVVGTDDVCASPLVAAVLRTALAGRRGAVRIVTAGVEARTGEPACGVTGVVLGSAAGLDAHRSTTITAAQVRAADLVLVMDREQRALVNRLVPGRQRTVFTVREAASLALRDGADSWTGKEPISRFAEELHRRRGLVVPRRIPVPRRGLLRRPVSVLDVDDLPDGHVLDDDAHTWALEAARTAAAALAAALRGGTGEGRAAA